MKKNPRVFFLHIPRTGGTSLNTALQHMFGMPRAFEMYHKEKHALFHSLSPEEKAQIEYFSMHREFGFHELLPGPFTYITMFRETTDRIVSHYHYMFAHRWENRHGAQKSVIEQNMPIRDYVTSGIVRDTDNDAVRKISGVGWSAPFGKTDRGMLDQAKDNLQKYFSLVGLFEEYDKTMILIRRLFGWHDLFYIKQADAMRSPHFALDDEDRTVIEEFNAYDRELYAYAQELFSGACAREDQDFNAETAIFKKYSLLKRTRHAYAAREHLTLIDGLYKKGAFGACSLQINALLNAYPRTYEPVHDGDEALFRYEIGVMLQYAGNTTDAAWWLHMAQRCSSDRDLHVRIAFHLGELAFIEKEYDRAEGYFIQCIRVMPEHYKAKKYCEEIHKCRGAYVHEE